MKKPQPRPRFPQYPQQLGVRNLAILRQHENRAMSENCLLIDDREDSPNKRASCLKMMQTCRHLVYPARSPILPQLNEWEPRQQHLSSHLLYSTMRRCEAALMTFKRVLKGCCLAVLVLLVFVGLGPARWQPRSGLGWEIDHFVGYFVITLMCCLAWPRPLVVGEPLCLRGAAGGLASFNAGSLVLLAGGRLQRSRGAGGALFAELFIRARKRFLSKRAEFGV